ncbi:MAG: SOS response-associated peptidase [Solirubrobacterales bacterium]
MCGRYTLANANPDVLKARFGIDILSDFDERPRFNIAPTDPVLGIRTGAGRRREAGRLRWGLLPGEWANDGARPLINARAETIAEQPAFRDSFLHRRCLIPADGFYEWRASEIGKQPVWISRADEAPFAFAGIWATLDDREDAVHSCAFVTCEPNELVRPIHDRMPVILTPDAEGSWIGEGEPDALMDVLRPCDPAELAVREVSDAVNDVREDGPHLLAPPLRLF